MFAQRKRLLPKHSSLLSDFPHSQCVYYQTMIGMANTMKLTEWEWKQENILCIAIRTRSNSAPEELLNSSIVTVLYDVNPLDAAADAMDSPCTAECGPCQTENIDNPKKSQEVVTDDEEDDTDTITI
ncbi:hypothetical protein DPMN_014605 [Dreissena polymorpha]|uniref:Uncharacterized protein n=1 Tax=Dreissena polymorpha TaxID=45954 RepID=A0A9D4S3L5_DREPO|nr:hypothetical protein DPMN_014605 [Dreissena polymorpha]